MYIPCTTTGSTRPRLSATSLILSEKVTCNYIDTVKDQLLTVDVEIKYLFKVGIQPVQHVPHFVKAFLLGHLEVAVLVKGIGLEEETDLVTRVEKVAVLGLQDYIRCIYRGEGNI